MFKTLKKNDNFEKSQQQNFSTNGSLSLPTGNYVLVVSFKI